jgi:DNA-binding response OmpR family regulator
MSPKKTTVLVVDDDVRILRMMQHILELKVFKVLVASNGETALQILDEETPDLILLDIMMPDIDGYTVCKRIREFSMIPIIMVTAKGDDEEKVKGLDTGADDYISKPFSSKELVARVRAVLRRSKLQDKRSEPTFHYRGLSIDFNQHRATLDSHELNLTATEYKILTYLAQNAGRLATPDQILEKVWGEEYAGETHLLQVNVARLRQKLNDDASNPTYIATKPGIGYMLMKETEVQL